MRALPKPRVPVAARRHSSRMRGDLLERRMEFTALFLAVIIVMLVAWWGARTIALTLFAITLAATVATYLHHASDVLKLSF
jgi:hypothetical protein